MLITVILLALLLAICVAGVVLFAHIGEIMQCAMDEIRELL
jgi:hypothetical protein